jgi:hypothetical protein
MAEPALGQGVSDTVVGCAEDKGEAGWEKLFKERICGIRGEF